MLGSRSEFRKRYERPILRSREPDALASEVTEATRLQKDLSTIVNEFILKRGNILNARHLPPKLVQFVCCRLTSLQVPTTHYPLPSSYSSNLLIQANLTYSISYPNLLQSTRVLIWPYLPVPCRLTSLQAELYDMILYPYTPSHNTPSHNPPSHNKPT